MRKPKVEYLHPSPDEDEEARPPEAVYNALSTTPHKQLYIPRNTKVTRAEIVSAFHRAFEMIGGVPRFALWADANPTEFYKLYSRMLPATTTKDMDGEVEIVVKHVLPPSPLDVDGRAAAPAHGDEDS